MGLFSKKTPPPPPPPVPQAPPAPSMQEIIFKMRFTSKTIGRQATKSQKEIGIEERKARDALAKGNTDGARIFAENVIRKKNEHLNYLKLQSQLDAVASKLQAQEVRNQVSSSMVSVTQGLDQALSTMDVTQIGTTMEKFISQSEDLDLQTKYMDSAIGESTSSSTPRQQVDTLLAQIADQNNLDISGQLHGVAAPSTAPTAIPGTQQADDLEARMAALRGGR